MSAVLVQTVGLMRRNKTPPTIIYGLAENGGYFAGIIVVSGARYRLIISPVTGGYNSSRRLMQSDVAMPSACQTLNDGKSATDALIAANTPTIVSYSADFAKTARTSAIGGYGDWYIPARDELELLMRNLKPSAVGYTVSARLSTGFGGGGNNGTNSNSDPVGAAYSASNPTQTTETAFKTGGAQAIAAVPHWTCTENNTTNAWVQSPSDGVQTTMAKSTFTALRLVRKTPA